MKKKILITGSTDGIGLKAAEKLVSLGHHVLIHGRNQKKLNAAETSLKVINKGRVESFTADLSNMYEVRELAKEISEKHKNLDVLINNAGVLKVPNPKTKEGLDLRFVVNTIAPYLLTKELLPLLNSNSRVVNVSSAAHAPVQMKALFGQTDLEEYEAYAQSKLAITMWSRYLAIEFKKNGGPIIIAVNPGSLLASKMVKEGFGIDGKDLSIGANILTSLALDEEHKTASGKYYDNDAEEFNTHHPDVLDEHKSTKLVETIEQILE